MLQVEHGRTSYQGPVIDTHAFVKGEGEFGQAQDSSPFFELPQFSDTKFLVIAPYASENKSVHDAVVAKDQYLGSYLMFNPNPEGPLRHSEDDSPRSIQMLAEQEYVVGLKTIPSLSKVPLNDALYRPYWELASKAGIPVLVHFSGSAQIHASPVMVKKILDKYPDLKLIAAHFGGLKPEYMEWMTQLADEAPNLYLNTTAMVHAQSPYRYSVEEGKSNKIPGRVFNNLERDILAVFLDACGRIPERILFGSDLGYHTPDDYSLWPVNRLPEDLQKQILLDNPQRLFAGKMKPIA